MTMICKFTPREGEGYELKPELRQYIGKELELRKLWLMDEDDPYPNEWALGNSNRYEDVLPDLTWIASGDVEVLQ